MKLSVWEKRFWSFGLAVTIVLIMLLRTEIFSF